MKIIAQSFCWNSAQFIAAPILAIHKYVDEIQCFDGAYQFMKKAGYAKVPYSTDGTEQVLKALKLACPLKWIPCTGFYENEVAKKMFMQQNEFWKPNEWKYLLSDDEIPTGDIAGAFNRVRNNKEALAGYIPMLEVKNLKPGAPLVYFHAKPRLLKWQPGLHWEGNHWNLLNGKGQPRDKWPRITLTEMTLIHLKWLRIRDRLKMQLDYEKLGL